MRTVDHKVKEAVETGGNYRTGNTKVETIAGVTTVHLFGNRIFHFDRNTNTATLDTCGWDSQTTVARLNGCLMGVGAGFGLKLLKKHTVIAGGAKENRRISHKVWRV